MSYRMVQGAAPATPVSGKSEIYVGTDRRVRAINDLGVTDTLSQWDWKENILVNGGFDLAQRQVPATLTTYSSVGGRVQLCDHWFGTNENASIQYARVDTAAAPEVGLGARCYGKILKLTAGGKFAIGQVVEASNVCPLRGRVVRFQAKMKYGVNAMTVRLGLLQLAAAGTVDTVPSSGSAFFTAFGAVGVDPTLGTALAYIAPTTADGGTISGNAMTCVLSNQWVRYSATFLVPTDCKNLIPLIWTNGQPATNDTLLISEVALFDGQEIMDWTPRPLQQEIALCQRRYCKTFAIDTAPAQNVGVNTGEHKFIAGIVAAGSERSHPWQFPVRMRATPGTVTAYNPAAANAQVRDETAAGDCSAQAFAGTTDAQTAVTCTGNASTVVGGLLGVHITADAEM